VEIKILRKTQDSAIYDELTRLYNVRYFQDRAVSEVRRATRYDAPLSPGTWPCAASPRFSRRRCARWTWRRGTGARSSRSCSRAPRSSPPSSWARRCARLPGRFNVLEKGSHPLTTLNVSDAGVLFHTQEPLPTGAFVKVQLAVPSAEPVECVARVMRVVGARGGFEIGTEIIHMPSAHQRRFRQFLKELKVGEIAHPPSARRRKPRPVEPKPRGVEIPEVLDNTLPLIPFA